MEFLKRVGIRPMAYASLGAVGTDGVVPRPERPQNLLTHPTVGALAEKHGRSAGQVLLNWGLQRGHIVIPKTTQEKRLRENWEAQQFALDEEEVEALTALDCGYRAFNALLMARYGNIPVFE